MEGIQAQQTPLTTARALLKSMRPRQWTKNAFVFAALLFDGKLLQPEALARTSAIFLCFCMVSAAVYLLNDVIDIKTDREHPVKRRRPLASGQLSPSLAMVVAAVLAVVGLGGAFLLTPLAGIIVLAYLAQNVAYSLYLKQIVLLDVMVISLGFLLRVAAGVVVVSVSQFSPWLYICTTLLALFLALGKRRHEMVLLAEDASNHRRILDHYTLPFIDQLIGLVTTAAILAYVLYTFESRTIIAPGYSLMLTIPFVLYGLFRYLYLIHVQGEGGAPEELLLQDWPLLLSVALWGLSVVSVIYVLPLFV